MAFDVDDLVQTFIDKWEKDKWGQKRPNLGGMWYINGKLLAAGALDNYKMLIDQPQNSAV